MTLVVEVAGPAHQDALAELFRATQTPCFCRFWHFEGDKNAWLERCALAPEKNEAEMRDALAHPALQGLVAHEADVAVGWMKLAARATLPKLRARPVYRSLDLGPDEGVLSIGCMLVRSEARGRGVARALVTSSIEIARARGARAIEAYPHAASPLGPHEIWMGPADLFASLGFRRIAGEIPYPVLRRDL
jgi:GNAT superfamily N-acetyltransferase